MSIIECRSLKDNFIICELLQLSQIIPFFENELTKKCKNTGNILLCFTPWFGPNTSEYLNYISRFSVILIYFVQRNYFLFYCFLLKASPSFFPSPSCRLVGKRK